MCSTAALSLGVTLVSGLAQANSQRQAADYNSAVARNNAALSRQQAAAAQEAGALERDRSILQFSSAQAQANVAYGAGNVRLGSGTPLTYQIDLQQKAKIDQNIIGQNAQNQANAFLSQSNVLLQEADFQQRQAKASMTVGLVGAASTLLGGVNRAGGIGTILNRRAAAAPAAQKPEDLDAFTNRALTTLKR